MEHFVSLSLRFSLFSRCHGGGAAALADKQLGGVCRCNPIPTTHCSIGETYCLNIFNILCLPRAMKEPNSEVLKPIKSLTEKGVYVLSGTMFAEIYVK